ncbi:MAG: ExbD/TolR family protein [Desulfomonilia bacterium]
MRFRRKRDKNISAMDITPLVDVVFLLLIFFMLSIGSPLKLSDIRLPGSSSGDGLVQEAIALAITPEGITVDRKTTTIQDLSALPRDRDIVILASREIPYFRVVEVLDALRSSRHTRVSLATKPLRN